MSVIEAPITRRITRNNNVYRNVFELVASHGTLDAEYDLTTGGLEIASVDVEPVFRGQGIGKALLRSALEIAQEQEARFISADIVSRECIDMMRVVFGEKAVQVIEEGDYLRPNGVGLSETQATLRFEVER
jgi:GNAT superfamily N-acetyltransferase